MRAKNADYAAALVSPCTVNVPETSPSGWKSGIAGGSVALHVGTVSTGQGHETMFAQMISDSDGNSALRDQHIPGRHRQDPVRAGSFAQRSMIAGGSALKLAAEEVIRKGKRLAAWMLEAGEADIDLKTSRSA